MGSLLQSRHGAAEQQLLSPRRGGDERPDLGHDNREVAYIRRPAGGEEGAERGGDGRRPPSERGEEVGSSPQASPGLPRESQC